LHALFGVAAPEGIGGEPEDEFAGVLQAARDVVDVERADDAVVGVEGDGSPRAAGLLGGEAEIEVALEDLLGRFVGWGAVFGGGGRGWRVGRTRRDGGGWS
jgi:hypothetical protein